MLNLDKVKNTDIDIYNAIMAEKNRQNSCIEMIASENFTSEAVMQAMGSYLTNKYAEGYPGNRYYSGCQNIDIIEKLACERACKLFGAEHANVQPHSGAQANEAVYIACLEKGDTVLSMSLNSGGHISHLSKASAQSRFYNTYHYEVSEKDYLIDYDEILNIALKCKPKLIIAGASAYPRKIDFAKFREIADQVNALLMVDMAHIAGLVAANIHMSPVPYADFVTFTTHKTLRGPRGGVILCKNEWAKKIDSAVFPKMQGGPLEHVIAAKAICLKEAMQEDFKKYQQQVINNAQTLAQTLIQNNINLVTNGTDNHLILIDLRQNGISGEQLANTLDCIGITANKNAIPFDTTSKTVTSGLRLGTPAITTRGLVEEDIKILAEIIAEIIHNNCELSQAKSTEYKQIVEKLCKKYPLYE